MDNLKELFPVVDEQGNITGCITRGEAHSGSMVLHPVVHLHVFKTARATSTCRSVPSGKTSSQASGTRP